VEAYDSASVRAYGSASVEAYDSASVRAYGNTTIMISEHYSLRVQVEIQSEKACVIDRRGDGKPKLILAKSEESEPEAT
jgi:hypothetical protein